MLILKQVPNFTKQVLQHKQLTRKISHYTNGRKHTRTHTEIHKKEMPFERSYETNQM